MGESATPPAAPAAPDYAAANQAGVQANIANLPAQNEINQAAQLGTKGSVTLGDGTVQNYDFTGLGNAALQDADAQSSLDLLNKYGSQFVSQETALTNQADPARAALNQQYENGTAQQLALGGTLDPSVAREVQQSARGGQAARGNILGDADAYSEAMGTGMAGEALQQQRTANAQATLGLAPVSSQFGNIGQATSPIAAASSAQAGQLNPNAGQLGSNYALGEFGDEASLYGTQSSNYQNAPANPWMTLAGTVLGAGAKLGAAAMM